MLPGSNSRAAFFALTTKYTKFFNHETHENFSTTKYTKGHESPNWRM